jgi:hypothetical protein
MHEALHSICSTGKIHRHVYSDIYSEHCFMVKTDVKNNETKMVVS